MQTTAATAQPAVPNPALSQGLLAKQHLTRMHRHHPSFAPPAEGSMAINELTTDTASRSPWHAAHSSAEVDAGTHGGPHHRLTDRSGLPNPTRSSRTSAQIAPLLASSLHPHLASPDSLPGPAPTTATAAPNPSQTDVPPRSPIISRLHRALVGRRPLSKTWERASFAEECRSAPASLSGLDAQSAQGIGMDVLRSEGRRAQRDGAQADVDGRADGDGREAPHGPEVQDYERARTVRHQDTRAHAPFSPTGRPTSLYASPAALRALKPLPTEPVPRLDLTDQTHKMRSVA